MNRRPTRMATKDEEDELQATRDLLQAQIAKCRRRGVDFEKLQDTMRRIKRGDVVIIEGPKD